MSEAPDNPDWIQTYTGKAFYFMEPEPDMICIEDIAHALSQLCRFGGHTRSFYSVAEHSILCVAHAATQGADRKAQLWALLHDAAEAYIVDMPRPIKRKLGGYKSIEYGIMDAVCQKFGLSTNAPGIVAEADAAVLNAERLQVMRPSDKEWSRDLADPANVFCVGLTPRSAEQQFLHAYERLK